MPDPAPEPDETQPTPGPPGMPAWLKISAAIAVVLAIVVIVALLVGGGEHSPGRHGAQGVITPGSTTTATSAGALG